MELIQAQDWYESEAPGLGRRFREAIDSLSERITDNPYQFPLMFKNIRRAPARHFPYSLFFIIEGDRLFVLACFHGSRDPSHWQKRV